MLNTCLVSVYAFPSRFQTPYEKINAKTYLYLGSISNTVHCRFIVFAVG